MVVGSSGRSSYESGASQFPTDPEIRTPALQAAQAVRVIAGEGTLELILLNVEHGVIVLADDV